MTGVKTIRRYLCIVSPLALFWVIFQASDSLAQTDWRQLEFFKKNPPGDDAFGKEVAYGADLFVNTPYYIGKNGIKGRYQGNRLTCQNCHIHAGTKPWGNAITSSHVRLPEYRAREGRVINMADRINACIQNPMIGRPLPLDSHEMRAFQAFLYWLAKGKTVGEDVPTDRLRSLPHLDRPADPVRGQAIFEKHCQSCHQADGSGILREDKIAYVYPPLWGSDSFGAGSSMQRLTLMASFVKRNMPYNVASHDKPVLTDEEAYDVSAYVVDPKNKRPGGIRKGNYPRLHEKPFDVPLGPYADPFSESQHRLGPFKPIIEYHAEKKSKK